MLQFDSSVVYSRYTLKVAECLYMSRYFMWKNSLGNILKGSAIFITGLYSISCSLKIHMLKS